MAKVNPCGYNSKIVFSSQKPISSSKSKTFFFILWDPFNPSTEEKVPFSKFFFASDFNNVPCCISSCRERCSSQIRRSTGTFYAGKNVYITSNNEGSAEAMSEIVLWVPSFGEQVTLCGFSLLKSCRNFAPRHLENCSKMAACCLHRLLTMLSYVDLRRGGGRSFLHSPKLFNTLEKCLDSSLKTSLHLCEVQCSSFL